MFRAFRIRNRDEKWFFDKSVWQRMFRTMSECGFDSMILENPHNFAFMIDLPSDLAELFALKESELARYQQMHHWIFETALDYDIAPYLSLAQMAPTPDVHRCVRTLMENYPEISGLFISTDGSKEYTAFVQQAIVDAVDAARPDASICLNVGYSEADSDIKSIARRGGRPIKYSVKYTGDHLVDGNPDPSFKSWVESVGSENVIAELYAANFEPWTSFSFDTVEEILADLHEMNCCGLSLLPLAGDWPRTSDTYFKYQFQRDYVWYSVWGGSNVAQLLREGQPKWLLRNKRIIEGFQAGSRILELLSLYFAVDKTEKWRPQFNCIFDPADQPHLLSVDDILHLGEDEASSKWWTQVTGDEVIYPAEYVKSGTARDAYGPDELIEELADLSEQAIAAGEKGMRNNSGEKELPGFTRDAFCMGRLGEFYVERLKAALAYARGENTEALDHMNRAIGHYREIRGVDSFHRTGEMPVTWTAVIKALESEYEDAESGNFKPGNMYRLIV